MPEYTVEDFAARFRNRYDLYHDLSDIELVDRIVAKYPVYAEQITDYLSPEDRHRDEQLTKFTTERFDSLLGDDYGELKNPWGGDIESPFSPSTPSADDLFPDLKLKLARQNDVLTTFRELDPDAEITYEEGKEGIITMPSMADVDTESNFYSDFKGKVLTQGDIKSGETPWNVDEFSLDPAIRKQQLEGFKKLYQMIPDQISAGKQQQLQDLQSMQPDDKVEAIENGYLWREEGTTSKDNLYGEYEEVNRIPEEGDFSAKSNQKLIGNFTDENGIPFSSPGESNTKKLFAGFSYRDFLNDHDRFSEWLSNAQSGKIREYAIDRLLKHNPTPEMITYAFKKYGVTEKEDIIARIAADNASPWAEYFFPIQTYENTHKMGIDNTPLLPNGKENPNYLNNVYYINAPAKGIPWKEWNALSDEEKIRRVNKGEGNITQIAEARNPEVKFFNTWDKLKDKDPVKKILIGKGPANMGEYTALAKFFKGKVDEEGNSLDFVDFDRPNWEKFTNRLDASTDWETALSMFAAQGMGATGMITTPISIATGANPAFDNYNKKLAQNNLEDWWLEIKENPTVQKYINRISGQFGEIDKAEMIKDFGWDKKSFMPSLSVEEMDIQKDWFRQWNAKWEKYRDENLPNWEGDEKELEKKWRREFFNPAYAEWKEKRNFQKDKGIQEQSTTEEYQDKKISRQIDIAGDQLTDYFYEDQIKDLPDYFDEKGNVKSNIAQQIEEESDKSFRDIKSTYSGPGSSYQLGLDYIAANNITDRSQMYDARDNLYWKLISLAKIIIEKSGEVGSMRYDGTIANIIGKIGTKFKDQLFQDQDQEWLQSWTGDITRIKKLAETGYFGQGFRLIRSNHPLAQEFNQTLKDFQALHEVTKYNKDIFSTERDFSKDYGLFTGAGAVMKIGSVWDQMFTGYDVTSSIDGGGAELDDDERSTILSNYLSSTGYNKLSPHVTERLHAGWGEVAVETTSSIAPLVAEIALIEAGGGAKAVQTIGNWANRLKNASAATRRSKLWNGMVTNIFGGGRYYGTAREMPAGVSAIGEMIKIAGADELGHMVYGRDRMGLTFGASMGYGMAMGESLFTSQLGRRVPFLAAILRKVGESRAVPSRFLGNELQAWTGAGLGYMSMQVAAAAQGYTNQLLGEGQYDLAAQLQGMTSLDHVLGETFGLRLLGLKGTKIYDALSKDIHYGFKGPYPEYNAAKKELGIKTDTGETYETKDGEVYASIDDLYNSKADDLLNDKRYENDLEANGNVKPESELATKLNDLRKAKRNIERHEDLMAAKEIAAIDQKKNGTYQQYKNNLYFLKSDFESGMGLNPDMVAWVGSGNVSVEILSATLNQSKAWAERFIEQQGAIMDMATQSQVYANSKYRNAAIEQAIKLYDVTVKLKALKDKKDTQGVENPELDGQIKAVTKEFDLLAYGNEKTPGLSALTKDGKANPFSLFAKTEPERLKMMENSNVTVNTLLDYYNSKGGNQKGNLEVLTAEQMEAKYPKQFSINPEGFFHINKDGSVSLVVNEEQALKLNPATSLHEFFHFIADSSFKDANGNVTPEGKEIIDQWLSSMPKQNLIATKRRIDSEYKYKAGERQRDEAFYIEYLPVFLDALGKGQAILPKNEFTKTLGEKIGEFFKDTPEINFDLSTVAGINNLMAALNKATSKPGKINPLLKKIIDKKIAEEKTEVPKEEAIEDANIPVEKETFTIEREMEKEVGKEAEEPEIKTNTVEVITNKDGSRTFTEIQDGQPLNVSRVGKENTLSNKEYVEVTYADVVGKSTVVKGTENINPKKADKAKAKEKTAKEKESKKEEVKKEVKKEVKEEEPVEIEKDEKEETTEVQDKTTTEKINKDFNSAKELIKALNLTDKDVINKINEDFKGNISGFVELIEIRTDADGNKIAIVNVDGQNNIKIPLPFDKGVFSKSPDLKAIDIDLNKNIKEKENLIARNKALAAAGVAINREEIDKNVSRIKELNKDINTPTRTKFETNKMGVEVVRSKENELIGKRIPGDIAEAYNRGLKEGDAKLKAGDLITKRNVKEVAYGAEKLLAEINAPIINKAKSLYKDIPDSQITSRSQWNEMVDNFFSSKLPEDGSILYGKKKRDPKQWMYDPKKSGLGTYMTNFFVNKAKELFKEGKFAKGDDALDNLKIADSPSLEATEASMRKNKALDIGPAEIKIFEDITRKFLKDNINKISKAQGNKQALSEIFDTDLNKYLDKNITEMISKKMPKGYKEAYKNFIKGIYPELIKLANTRIGKDGVMIGDPYVFINRGGKQFQNLFYKPRGLTARGDVKRIKVGEGKENPAWDFLQPSEKAVIDFFTTDKPGKPRKDSLRKPLARIISKTIVKDYTNKVLSEAWEKAAKKINIDKLIKDPEYKVPEDWGKDIKDNPYSELTTDQLRSVLKDNLFSDVANTIIRSEDFITSKSKELEEINFKNIEKNLNKKWGPTPEMLKFISIGNIVADAERFRIEQPKAFKEWLRAAEIDKLGTWYKNNPQYNKYFETAIIRGKLDKAYEAREDTASFAKGIDALPDTVKWNGKDIDISGLKEYLKSPEAAMYGTSAGKGKQKAYFFNETVLKKYIDHAIKFAEKLPPWLGEMANKEAILQTIGLGTTPTGKSALSVQEAVRRADERIIELQEANKELRINKPKNWENKIKENNKKIAKEREKDPTPKILKLESGKLVEMWNTPWVRNQADRAMESLGKNESKAFEGLKEKLKDFYSDAQMKTQMGKEFKDLTDAEIAEFVSKKINEGNNAIRREVYDAIQKAKEEYIAEAKTEVEILDRIEYVLRKAKENTNLVQGLDRQAVPIEAIYWPKGKRLNLEKLKLEHLKTSVDQSMQSAKAIVEGKWDTEGRKSMEDYVGVLSPERLLDIIDHRGKRTNTSTIARMVLDIAELKNYRTVESGFKETYYDKIIREAGADIKLTPREMELIKSEALAGSVAEWAVNRNATGRKILKTAVENAKTLEKVYKENQSNQVFSKSRELSIPSQIQSMKITDKALELGRKKDKEIKKARIFDFDDTIARTNSKVFATKGNEKKTLTAEEFAKQGEMLVNEGWKMDFSDFNKVVEGKKGPLFDVMKKMKEAAGERDLFILTARAPQSAKAIHTFLKEMGIDIPLRNITGLGNSTGAAKGEWVLQKASEGYNDFYFADDAIQNVRAVKDVLNQLDVKSKVQQALSKSEGLSDAFNKLLQGSTGTEWYKEFSKAKAQVLGKDKGKGKIILPSSAEDYLGLVYTTLGKGKMGENQLKWYQQNVINPYNRGVQSLRRERTNMMADFKALKKQLDVPKELREITESGFTNEQAVRVYLWSESGMEIPGISKRDLKELTDIVKNNPTLEAFAKQIQMLLKGDVYSTPKEHWLSGTITTDLIDVLNTTKRNHYLKEFKENVDAIYSEANLNKLEALYGTKYRNAIENIIRRMKSGKNRTGTESKITNDVLDYINGSVGTIMFFNTRSALLQTISAANFINLTHNNPIRAGKAFANQKQYWKDFMELMNSEYLIDRRNGLKLNISESEIADAAASSRNKAKAVINYILEKGYLPTKFADSFAIASGGATWYRNKIIDLIKEGKTEAQAKEIAMKEFIEISEMSQQSSDPSKISGQQASTAGRVFLQFVNTPMQYTRLQKRAFQDLVNGRGDWKANISKILYYGVMQNLWFNAMQQGLFALGFGDGEIGEKEEEKIYNTMNGMADSILRGSGFTGMTISVLKNTLLDLHKRSGKSRPEYQDAWQSLLQFSPAIRSKFMKLKQAGWAFDSKARRQEILDKGFSLDNPAYEAAAKVISATTNLPLDRLFIKYENLENMVADDTEMWERVANFFGWPSWQLETSKSQKEKMK